ncbi:glycoside hydrolase family 108 protein [Labilibaculum euxinus]
MAQFGISYHITEQMEGGYSNNPHDKGGETYAGISRVSFPDWKGWAFLDKQAKPIKTNSFFSYLSMPVMQFYKAQFWSPLKCGFMSQVVANQLFDYAVNSGKSKAVKSLQTVLNRLGAFLQVDGVIGEKTLTAMARFNQDDIAGNLLIQRENFINRLALQQPQFKRVWLNRIAYLKSHLSTAGVSFGLIAIAGLTLFF